ncbi:hypothetical protein GQ457_04G013470 [Hibiscus cannabinus]
MEATALEIDSPDVCNRCAADCPPKVNTVTPRTLYTQSSERTMAQISSQCGMSNTNIPPLMRKNSHDPTYL